MLAHFRKLADHFFTKLLLLLIVASFILWGVGDMVTTNRNIEVVSVGDTTISANEYYGQLQRIKSNLGEYFSPEIVKQLHLLDLSLNELISKKLYSLEALFLHVQAGESLIKKLIAKEDDFHNENGLFDPTIFTRRLQQMRTSEQQFINVLKENITEEIMQSSLTPHTIYPESAMELFFTIEQQKRAMLSFTLTEAQLKDAPKMDEEAIHQFYDAHKENYNAPEYRSFEYIILDKEALEQAVNVSEEILRQSYLQRQKELMIPEKRDIWQLLYNNKADAERAYGLLRNKEPIEEITVTIPPLNAEEIQLGAMAKHQLSINADEVFDLDKGGFTSPVKSDFGWHIFIVRDIQPAFVPAYAALKDQLKADIIKTQKNNTLRQLLEKLEDNVAANMPISDIATSLSLSLRTSPPIDISGKQRDNTPAFDATEEAQFLKVGFALKESQLSNVEQLKNGNYFISTIKEIIPARVRALEEVRGSVVADAEAEQRKKALRGLGEDITKTLHAHPLTSQEQAKHILAEYGVQDITLLHVMRDGTITNQAKNQEIPPLPASMNDALFNATTPFSPLTMVEEGHYLRGGIFLEEITPDVATNASAYSELKTRLQKHVEQEVLLQYVRSLQQRYPVVRNQQAIDAVNEQF